MFLQDIYTNVNHLTSISIQFHNKNPYVCIFMQVAHNIFEEGLKLYMSEPVYILKYADFLTRLNDDRNIRALFERALSTLPVEDSAEVWKRFIQFEQTYGDLASILKVF
jgi:cleavage stimulation factor subunit 3